MISRALFIIVAESMLTLGPIDQVGWARASSTLAWAICSAELSLNGPPEAVINTFSISLRLPLRAAWKIAECSESTGIIVAL